MTDNLPAGYKDAARAFLDALAAAPVPLLKFKKTKFVVRDTEVPLGTEFIAYLHDWARGWVKFMDDELVDKKIGRVIDRFSVPERDELGDADEELWERGDDGKPRDPWVRQDYLPLENAETGEHLVFVTPSFGGRIAIEALAQRFARNVGKGLPRVKLATGMFHTKKFGEITRPDFPITAWESDGRVDITPRAATPRHRVDEEGPPENDPADPGYDFLDLSRD
jgi:hypothetical protein